MAMKKLVLAGSTEKLRKVDAYCCKTLTWEQYQALTIGEAVTLWLNRPNGPPSP